MSKIGKNKYHLIQKEIEKKEDVIIKLKSELAKNCSSKCDIERIITKMMTKDMHMKAKKMNIGNNGDLVWRVRGSPRTSLHLVLKPKKTTKKTRA